MKVTDTLLCRASLLSYEKNPKIGGFKSEVIKRGNDTCVIYHNENDVIIAFAGTDDGEDVMADIKFFKKKTPYGKVHKGFYNAWEDLQDGISEVIHVRKLHGKKTYITGHSLGGALAMLCAVNFVYRGCIQRVVTFGSPRVGNKKWKTAYDKICGGFKTIRYVNDQDIVTKVPKIFYWHVGKAIYFDNKGNIVNKRPNKIWRLISKRIEGIMDHALNKYYKVMLKNNL